MAEGVDNGISGGNDREDRIGKFLREAPLRSVMLLLTGDASGKSDGAVLATWGKEMWSEQLATLVNAEMENQHDMADAVDSYYWLIFVGADPNDVTATRRRRFNVRTRKQLTAIGDDGLPKLSLDGSNATQATLNQTILFKMVALYSTNMQQLLNSQNASLAGQGAIIKQLTELFVASKEDEKAARTELHELMELVIEDRAQRADTEGEMTEAQKAWLDLAQKYADAPEFKQLVQGIGGFLAAKFAK